MLPKRERKSGLAKDSAAIMKFHFFLRADEKTAEKRPKSYKNAVLHLKRFKNRLQKCNKAVAISKPIW